MATLKGDSATPNVPAVFGENTAQGDGVFGQGGDNGRGVVGVSAKHTGVEGTTIDGAAVFGSVNGAGRGVIGVAKSNTAVEGNSTSGAGLFGSSQTGIGVFGKGGRLAGFFEGNVEITGNLTIQGVSIQTWLQRIQKLEQQVADLQRQLGSSSGTGSGTGGGGTSSPRIAVTQGGSSGGNLNTFTISGSGFGRNENVTIKVISRSRFGSPSSSDTPTVADSAGNISHAMGLFCDGGMTHEFTAVSASGRSSNMAGSSC